MGKDTGIEWADHTFNPWMGCTKVSPACDFCYAEKLVTGRMGLPLWGKDAARKETSLSYWNQPFAWNRAAQYAGVRARVFCGSLCDVMEDREDQALSRMRADLWQMIPGTPWLDWLLVTKRPQNFPRFLPARWLESPLPNVWGMTTVESAEYLWRVDELLKVPFAVRGLSMEPLLGPVDLRPYMWPMHWHWDGRYPTPAAAKAAGAYAELKPQALLSVEACNHLLGPRNGWVIVGGESGADARPTNPRWVRSLRDQCVGSGVSFFFKQWGEWAEVDEAKDGRDHQHDVALRPLPAGPRACFIAPDGEVIRSESEMRADVPYRWMHRAGKKAAGRLLDGCEWNEVPMIGAIGGEAAGARDGRAAAVSDRSV
jgi:protein gp37